MALDKDSIILKKLIFTFLVYSLFLSDISYLIIFPFKILLIFSSIFISNLLISINVLKIFFISYLYPCIKRIIFMNSSIALLKL
jgi:hypothetical protein